MSDTTNNAGDDCCPANDNPKKRAGFLRNIFKKCAACAGAGGAGFLAGHAGCIVTPLVIAATGATAATGGMSILALAFGAAATAGGIYLWHRLRGKTAGIWEKRIVIGSAVTGLMLSTAFHFAGRKHDHHNHHNHGTPTPMPREITVCGRPASATTADTLVLKGAK